MSERLNNILRLSTIALFLSLLCRTVYFAGEETIYFSIVQGIYEVGVIALCILQVRAKSVDLSMKSFFVVGLHLMIPMLFTTERSSSPLGVYPLILVVGGFAFSIISLIDLSRFFGVLPAFRGVRTNGMYGYVRHPAYMGYIIASFGVFLSFVSLPNLILLIAYIGATNLRISLEEAILVTCSKEYSEYSRKVVCKLVPGVF